MVKDLEIDTIIFNKKNCSDNIDDSLQRFVKFQAKIVTMEGDGTINDRFHRWFVMGCLSNFSKIVWYTHTTSLSFSVGVSREVRKTGLSRYFGLDFLMTYIH